MRENKSQEYWERVEERLQRYCSAAEGMIEAAPQYASAVQLKESLCTRFEQECESSLVATAARKHLDSQLKQHRDRPKAEQGEPM